MSFVVGVGAKLNFVCFLHIYQEPDCFSTLQKLTILLPLVVLGDLLVAVLGAVLFSVLVAVLVAVLVLLQHQTSLRPSLREVVAF